jgi:hypothetical protein
MLTMIKKNNEHTKNLRIQYIISMQFLREKYNIA